MFGIIPYRNHQSAIRRENRGSFEDFANDFFRPFFTEGFGWPTAQRALRVDVLDEGDRFVLKADLPGVKRDDLSVTVGDGVLTISAGFDETDGSKDGEDRYVCRERRIGSVSRAFSVEGIREEGITAGFSDGVLRLELPKREPSAQPQPRAIAIDG